MRIILTATDFSENGNNAVEYAASISDTLNSKLIICHVITEINKNPDSFKVSSVEKLRLESDSKLNKIMSGIRERHSKLEVECFTIEGMAEESIRDFILKHQVELLIIGCTRMNYFERKLIGSTISKLINILHVPILCIPRGSRFSPIRKIAFATDLKDENINSALSIVTFAKHFGAEIVFIFVDYEDIVHSEEQISAMTKKIRERIHYTQLSGYVVRDRSLKSGIQVFQQNYKADIWVMFTYKNDEESSKRSKSSSITIAELASFPLLVLKQGVLSLI